MKIVKTKGDVDGLKKGMAMTIIITKIEEDKAYYKVEGGKFGTERYYQLLSE
jgi:hypothetical protein